MSAILVVREADIFSRILAANGYEVINLPLIATQTVGDLSDFEKKLARIANYDGIFLTSANAARIFVENLRRKRIDYGGKIYVLGKRGYEILRSENLEIVFDETANTAREFLAKIAPEKLKNKRLLFVRGEKSLRVVPEFLAEIAEIDETIVYETREIAVDIDKIEELQKRIALNEIAALCFFSPSAGAGFIKLFGTEILQQTVIAAIGKTTAGFFERRNLKAGFISPKATAEDFAKSLIKYLRKES